MRWAQDNGVVYDCIGATLPLNRTETAVGIHRYSVNFEGLRKGEDIFSFANSSANFKYLNEYAISREHYNLLISSLSTNDDITRVNKALVEKSNKGSCFGMSFCVALDKLGKIDFNGNFCRDTKTMYGVPTPISLSSANIWKTKRGSSSLTVSAVESAINYYQLTSYSYTTLNHDFEDFYYITRDGYCFALADMYEGQKTGGLGILSYHVKDSDLYHVITVYGKPSISGNNYTFRAYDNRFPITDTQVIISNNYNNSEITNGAKREIADEAIYFNSFDNFDVFDIDGEKNNSITANSTNAVAEEKRTPDLLEQGYAVLYIDTYGDYSITNAEGETLSKMDGVYSGTMDARLAKMIPLGTHAIYIFVTRDSDEFLFKTAQPSELLGVISNTIDQAVLGQIDYVSMQSDNMEVCGKEIQYVTNMPETEGNDLCTLRFFRDDLAEIILHFEDDQIISDKEDDSMIVEVISKEPLNK